MLSKRFEVMDKLSRYIKNIFENGWLENVYPRPSFYPPGHERQKPSKEFGVFQILGTISFVLF